MNLSTTKDLIVRDWKENVINLVQFPRAACIPSPSPFSLKLETFLKIANLPYKNVDNNFKHGSSKGQVPFIELNGRQHADSGNIMQFLLKEFSLPLDSALDSKQLADCRAYTILLEESFFRAVAYMRAQDPSWLFTVEKGLLGNFTGVKKFFAGNFGAMFSKSKLQKALQIQGMGRNSLPEVVEIMKRDLVALDTLLDGKKYFFGNYPTSFDATAFGHLAQLFYTPQPVDDVVTFAETTTPNLKAFVERIKAEYWPEWEEVTKNLLLNSKTAEEKAAEAVASVRPVVTEEMAPAQTEIQQ
uniref:Failed axon connections protein n=1 Tax=Panagrolaimus sp. JU765 TaxID=591449 RepID=A0AC34QN47_9BILA